MAQHSSAQDSEFAQAFRHQVLAWYDLHARRLPWRETHDPYRIWLSEIMLQQTRVAAVIAHYEEFLRRFPTLQKLASARESSVLAAWSGLGYYRRARMLHAAAKVIVKERDGTFPNSAKELQHLPGIGRYTSAAIASIAFREPVAVVDGNVERVLQRVSGRNLSQSQLWTCAQAMLDSSRPGDFNQAVMELGATVCTPRNPGCLTCPVVNVCAARGELQITGKAAPQQKRTIHYTLHQQDGKVCLVRRAKDATLMPDMWELPQISPASSQNNGSRTRIPDVRLLFTLRHSITVTDYTVRVWRLPASPDLAGKWFRAERLPQVALTGLTRKILRKAKILPLKTPSESKPV